MNHPLLKSTGARVRHQFPVERTGDSVSLYGEAWPVDVARRLCRAIEAALQHSATCEAGRVIEGTKLRVDSGAMVRIRMESGSEIAGPPDWARDLLDQLKEAAR